ncbi:MAG: LamG-like jellyroll fold domain-containing protein, partial [Planctomycetia bacterium]
LVAKLIPVLEDRRAGRRVTRVRPGIEHVGAEPRLERLAADATAPADARAGALWALEGLGAATPPLLAALAADPSADLRHEGVRIAATTCSESMFRRLAGPLVADPSPRVRAALGDALRRVPATEPDTLLLMMQLGRGRATGDAWTVYDRDFERYLARWALEKHSGLVAKVLDSPPGQALPIENRILATLALAPRTAAERLAGMLPMIGRPLEDEEIRVLASQAEEPAIAAALGRLTLDPKARSATLRALLKLRTSLKGESIEPIVARAVVELLGNRTNEADALLAVELAGSFRIRSVEPQVVELCRTASAGPLRQAAIRAIREMASLSGDSGRRLLQRAADDPRFRADVLDAWAHSRDPAACAAILEDWDQLGYEERRGAAASLARHREGATALVAAFTADTIDATTLPLSVLVDMRAVLPQNPALEHLWKTVVAGAPQVLRLTGQDRDVAAPIALEGPFTVEAWVNLEAPVGNEDSLLAKSGIIDMNFHDGTFRVWTMGRDVVVAQSKTTPDTWTHYAVTRDAEGTFRIYVDGELDAVSTPRETISYAGLRIGASIARGGTSGRVAEFRVWSTARTADEIRADFDRSYGDDDRPPSLVSFHGGTSWGELGGGARVEPALDAPRLVTSGELAKRAEKFARFRGLAEAGGDPARGRELFAVRCLGCHQQGGQGGRVGPALDGLGLTGVEAILRNVLTPNAAMEGGYRAFRVVTRDGRVVQGLLVSRDADAIVIRQPGTADIRIPSRDVETAEFTGVSVMPEGILESLSPGEVSDLFAHLRSLGKAATP